MKNSDLRPTIPITSVDMPTSNSKIKQAVYHHFQSVFGTGKLISHRGTIAIYKWPNPLGGRNVILTTVGMADEAGFRTKGTDTISARGTEVMMNCRLNDVTSMAQLLTDVAGHPKKAKTSIHWWHALRLGKPIAPDSELRNLFFTYPAIGHQFSTLESEGHRIDIVWAIPISDRERAIFESEGTDALEDKMEENGVNVSDLFRPSIA